MWKHAQETHTIHWMSSAEKSHGFQQMREFTILGGVTVVMHPAGSSQLTRADSRHQTILQSSYNLQSS